ncbi:hypothetical protein [Pannonibacter phragmitetus]|uniref:hypothetical protein n=1 Tax=Pannonibacter phragmitetus TaxID=121719 RepID=UPI000F038C98|nr:hypothetical protein [Pannonibacter phragmitetus]
MTGTLVLSLLGGGIYCIVAGFFLTFSFAELVETRNSSRFSAALAVVSALFWPVALVVATLAALMMRPKAGPVLGQQARTRAATQPAERLAA